MLNPQKNSLVLFVFRQKIFVTLHLLMLKYKEIVKFDIY